MTTPSAVARILGATLAATLLTSLPSLAQAQQCLTRPNIMYCGSTQRQGANLYSGVGPVTEVSGCTPDANTQIMFISRSGSIGGNGPAWLAYLNAGGRIVTEFNTSDDVYNAIYGTNYALNQFIGNCRDIAMPSVKLNPTHPFWQANPGLVETPDGAQGCGFNMATMVAAEPELTPLGGLISTPGSVTFALREQGSGLLFLLEADWQDGEVYPEQSLSRPFLGAVVTSCAGCSSDADCNASQVCDLGAQGSQICEPANTCGNGVVEAGEGCDDGANVSGDGCSDVCLIELGESCMSSPQCETGLCDSGICACNSDNDCEAGFICDTGLAPNSCEPAIFYSLTIAAPAANAALTTTTVVFSGQTEPGATVAITLDGSVIATVTASAAGAWTHTQAGVAQGAHSVSVAATDAMNNTANAGPINFSVDSIAPAPTIAAPTNGAALADNTPTISGTTEAGASVAITIDGSVVSTVTANGAGAWTYTSATLAQGAHSVSVVSTDAAGNSGNAGPVNFTVDTIAPAPTIAAPANGAFVADNTPTISGTTEGGASVAITIDGSVVATVTANNAGAWNHTSATLAQGAHSVSVVSTDAAGNSGNAGPVSFTIDTVAPAPTIAAPVNGAALADNTPTISGTTEAGASVAITIDGAVVSTVTASGTGAWTYTSATLAQGAHTVRVVSTDAAGNSGNAGPVNFTIDTIAPAPTIAAPANGAFVADSTPTISGTTEAGASVAITVDGSVVATVTANGSGAWTHTSAALADGAHTVRVVSTDAAGNSGNAGPVSFTIDTAAPAPMISTPAANALLAINTPVISGTTEAGASVAINIDGSVVTTVTANNAGAWTYTSAALADGAHTVRVVSTDAAGNSGNAGPVSFTIDTTAPDAPTIATPVANAFIADNTPTISGTTEAGASVAITVDGSVVATVTANGSGAWTHTSATLADGLHSVSVIATDAAGNASATTTRSFSVDTIAPMPMVISPADGAFTANTLPMLSGTSEAGAEVIVTLRDAAGDVVETLTTNASVAAGAWSVATTVMLMDGAYTIEVVSTDAAGNAGNTSSAFNIDATALPLAFIAPTAGQALNIAQPMITGTSAPSAEVTIELFDAQDMLVETLTAVADLNGDWSTSPTMALAEGDYVAEAQVENLAGVVSDASVGFRIDLTAPDVALIAPVADAVIADAQADITGSAEAGAQIEVTITNEAGDVIETLTTSADVTGMWSVTPTDALTDGAYSVAASATDEAGNVTTLDPVAFVVDTLAPTTTITSPTNDALLAVATPELVGTSEPGATITILVDSVVVGTTTADDAGDWRFTLPSALTDGMHTLTASSVDVAGNAGEEVSVNVTIDTAAPTLAITAPVADERVLELPANVTGTGEPGASVEVFLDGALLDTVTVAQDGTWSVALPESLTVDTHTVSAIATDAAGNTTETDDITFRYAPLGTLIISSPADGATIEDGAEVVVSGSGEPGAMVTVTIGEASQTATIGEDGTWSVTFTEVAPGATTITAVSGEQTVTANVTVSEPAVDGQVVSGSGCGCASAGGTPDAALPLWMMIAGFAFWRRRAKRA